MNVVDPIILAALAALDMLVLMSYRRRQVRRHQATRMREALRLAVRQAVEGRG